MEPRKFDGLLVECRTCKQMRPRGWFRWRMSRGKRVLRSQCRDCEKPARAAAASKRRGRIVGSYTKDDVRLLLVTQNWRCNHCVKDLRVLGYHVDHVLPIAKGGTNNADNLQLLCPKCNLRKGARVEAEKARLARLREKGIPV